MNKIRTSRFVGYTLAFLLLFVAIAPSAIAKHKPKTRADSVPVVAHLPLPARLILRKRSRHSSRGIRGYGQFMLRTKASAP